MQFKAFFSRSANVSDIADIANFAKTLDFGISMALLDSSINNVLSKVTVVKHEEELIGFAISGDFVCGNVTLMNIAVAAEHRANGFGSKMLVEHLDFWKRQGAVRCLLELRASNCIAKTFYAQAGFRFDGTREKYYRSRNGKNGKEDAILMSLNLLAR